MGVGHGGGWGKEDGLALGSKEVPIGRAAGGVRRVERNDDGKSQMELLVLRLDV